MKHFKCKYCDEVILNRHYHIHMKHKELHIDFKGDFSKLNSYFDEVEKIIGDTWTIKYRVGPFKTIRKRSWFRTIGIIITSQLAIGLTITYIPYPFFVILGLGWDIWMLAGLSLYSKKSVVVPDTSDKQKNVYS